MSPVSCRYSLVPCRFQHVISSLASALNLGRSSFSLVRHLVLTRSAFSLVRLCFQPIHFAHAMVHRQMLTVSDAMLPLRSSRVSLATLSSSTDSFANSLPSRIVAYRVSFSPSSSIPVADAVTLRLQELFESTGRPFHRIV